MVVVVMAAWQEVGEGGIKWRQKKRGRGVIRSEKKGGKYRSMASVRARAVKEIGQKGEGLRMGQLVVSEQSSRFFCRLGDERDRKKREKRGGRRRNVMAGDFYISYKGRKWKREGQEVKKGGEGVEEKQGMHAHGHQEKYQVMQREKQK